MKGYLSTQAFKVPLMKLVQPHKAPPAKPIPARGGGQLEETIGFRKDVQLTASCCCGGQQHAAAVLKAPECEETCFSLHMHIWCTDFPDAPRPPTHSQEFIAVAHERPRKPSQASVDEILSFVPDFLSRNFVLGLQTNLTQFYIQMRFCHL